MSARPDILILSVTKAEAFLAGPADVCISIRSPDADDAQLSSNFREVLRLRFHDLALVELPYPDDAVQLSAEDAAAIAAFVQRHRDARRIIVHCEAGISRSVAVALAISTTAYRYWAWPSWYRADDRLNRWVQNRRVFDLVCAAITAGAHQP